MRTELFERFFVRNEYLDDLLLPQTTFLIGEKGTGKSFIIEQLHQRLDEELAIVRIDASLTMTEDQLENGRVATEPAAHGPTRRRSGDL